MSKMKVLVLTGVVLVAACTAATAASPQISVPDVPEPSSILALAASVVGLAGYGLRKRSK